MTATPSQSALCALRTHPEDLVAVAIGDLAAGLQPLADGPVLGQQIPSGHKFALENIKAGEAIMKYGAVIGHASRNIASGEHVHGHNLTTNLQGELSYTRNPVQTDAAFPAPDGEFSGYRRSDGRVGTRNEIWVIATVGCVNRTAERIAWLANERGMGPADGVHAITHPFGCSQLGNDLERTRTILAALAQHPNAGGVILVGLGCETNQVQALFDAIPNPDPARIKTLSAQGEHDEIEAGIAAVAAIAANLAADRRETCDVCDLVVGLKCGGSDAFSGLTANPLVGRIADRVDAAGGTIILTEIPEMFGAEHLLLARAASSGVADALGLMVNRFKRYYLDHGEVIHGNPSPGNIAGGITTLEEKSLGAVQKAGSTPVRQVLDYGHRVSPRAGMAILEAPGNDAVSTTALVAAGATVILFTTGRGTPLGTPVPTLKISSNTTIAEHKPHWIDFDAGSLLAGNDMASLADRLFDLLLHTATGQLARNERAGEREIAIWKDGVTL